MTPVKPGSSVPLPHPHKPDVKPTAGGRAKKIEDSDSDSDSDDISDAGHKVSNYVRSGEFIELQTRYPNISFCMFLSMCTIL